MQAVQRVTERSVDMCAEITGPLSVRREPGDRFVAHAGRVYIRRPYGCLVALPDPADCRLYLQQRRYGVRMAIVHARLAARYGESRMHPGQARRAVDLALREYRTAWRCLHKARALLAEAREAAA